MGIMKMECYAMIFVIAYMIYYNHVLVWNTIDMMITICFLVYINSNLPEHVRYLFRFFNLQWWGTNPEIISFFVGIIDEQKASENFERRGKTTLFLAN